MKLLIFLLLCLESSSASNNKSIIREFVAWQVKWERKKIHRSIHRVNKAILSCLQKKFGKVSSIIDGLAAFKETKALTSELNQKFESGKINFRAAPNIFADLSRQKREAFTSGFRPPAFGVEGRSMKIISSGQVPPGPPSFDWRDYNAVTNVKDQSFFCNCCWAFSAVAALESQFIIKKGKNYTLSEQNLIDCNKDQALGNWGCEGGSQSSAYMYVQEEGIEEEKTYPYQEDTLHESTFPCHFNSSNSVGTIKGFYRMRPKNEKLVKDVLAAYGPIGFSFNGSLESFLFYQGGVYDDPQCKG